MSEVPSVRPDETAAVVVGIEHYADPVWWLPGVAADARQFAKWLVGRGVPPERILLLLSERGKQSKNEKVVLPNGQPAQIKPQAAKYERVREAFLTQVRAWGKEVGLLLVYWAGHGFVDGRRTRRLDCADSHTKDRRAFPFDSLLMALLSPDFPSLQVGFVDACAIDMGHQAGDAEAFQPVAAINPQTQQFILYSQRPGLTAPNERSDDPDSFFSALCRELTEEEKEHPAAWPPDLLAVSGRVRTSFKKRYAGKVFGQFPVFYRVNWDWSEEVDPGFYSLTVGRAAVVDEAHAVVVEAHAEELTAALKTLGFFAQEHHRGVFRRELRGWLSEGLEPTAEAKTYLRRLAENILARPGELGRLLDVFDWFSGLREDAALEQRVFTTLDKHASLGQTRWAEVARLRRLIAPPGRDADRQATEEAVDLWVGREVRQGFKDGALAARCAESASRGTGSLLLWLAGVQNGTQEPYPLLRLAGLVAKKTSGQQREGLNAWIAQAAALRALPDPGLAAPEAAKEPALPERVGEPIRLMVVVERLVYGNDRFVVRTFLDRGDGGEGNTPNNDQTRGVGEIAALINGLLRNIPGSVEVELFLPVDLLARGLGEWRVRVSPTRAEPIDERFPVKLRSWDRVYNRNADSYFDEQAVKKWKALWSKLPVSPGVIRAKHCVHLDWSQPDGDGRVALPARAGPVITAGSLVPTETKVDAARADVILEEFLLAGTPIALWPDARIEAGNGASKVPERIKALVKGRRPDELPGLVHQRRQGSETAADPDPLRHLCLLWDDPDRLPPDREQRVASPGYVTQ